MNEVFDRIAIIEADRHMGYASVRYPVTGVKVVDKYYKELAQSFIKASEKKKQTGMLYCHVSYNDEDAVSVITEARTYNGSECVSRHRSSLVWDKKRGTLRYLRKHGIRCCNVCYNGRELKKFD